jgi:cell division septal protein FtsQ
MVECGAALFTSPWLDVKHIVVAGTSALPAAEQQAVARAVASLGHRNWLLAPVATTQRSLKQLPWVADAQVIRRFPDSIQIRIRPRESLFTVRVGPGSYEVDADGVPIRATRPAASLLPLVTLPGATTLRCGQPIDDEGVRAAVRIIKATRQDAIIRIIKIEVDLSHNLCLNMQDGLPIRIGQPEILDDKIALLRRIYNQRPDIARSLAAIDVSCPSAPACTPRRPSAMADGVDVQEPDRFE